MFLTDCHACGLRELRGARAIELLVNPDSATSAMHLVYRCSRCEAVNVLGAPEATSAPVPAATPVAA